MNTLKIIIKKPGKYFSKSIFKLVKDTKILDVNSEYLYLLQTIHFRDTCSIAVINDEVVGFVSGYKIPESAETLFIWQMAVDEKVRGQGLAKKLMKNILTREEYSDIKYIHTTVSPSNKSSVRAFEKLAEELNTGMKAMSFFEKDDFINQHEEEVLYEIGPFKLK